MKPKATNNTDTMTAEEFRRNLSRSVGLASRTLLTPVAVPTPA